MKKHLKLIITFGIGIIAFIAIILSKQIFQQTELLEIYKILSDASFVPAVVIGGVGIIVFVDNNGVFDIIIYGVKIFSHINYTPYYFRCQCHWIYSNLSYM